MRNKDGDVTGLISVKPPTASASNYQDTLMQAEFLKKEEADLLLMVLDKAIEQNEKELNSN